ncbi:hypothetical protein [Enterococcus phage SSsP-1]|uniref:Uncharacterized protein n=1 Tax=Enterococcus phage SSsP-1 TaxID=2859527 RepID=A0AAE7WEB5_9CAUD|nr:hypothetical protein [Enterococcus phage SSsP-1]
MKRFAVITKIELDTPDEDRIELGKAYEIVEDVNGGVNIYIDDRSKHYFVNSRQYVEVAEGIFKLTLGMLLSKLNEDASVNLEISFEDKATKIVSENYYKDELKDYFDREVKWYSPDTVVDGLSILLEGEFSNGN